MNEVRSSGTKENRLSGGRIGSVKSKPERVSMESLPEQQRFKLSSERLQGGNRRSSTKGAGTTILEPPQRRPSLWWRTSGPPLRCLPAGAWLGKLRWVGQMTLGRDIPAGRVVPNRNIKLDKEEWTEPTIYPITSW